MPRPPRPPILLLALLVLLFAGCRDSSGPGGGAGSFALALPDSAVAGRGFSVTVTALRADGSQPDTDFSGAVALRASAGTLTPGSVTLTAGSGSAQLRLSGAEGSVTLTAEHAGRSGSAALMVRAATDAEQLPGEPHEPAAGRIPRKRFVARAEDYADNHPALPGMFLSFNTLTLVLALQTTVQQTNALLDELGAEITGGIPGVPNTAPGILTLRLPTRTHAEMEAVLARLRADARVRHVRQDALLDTEVIPRPNGGIPANWTWELTPGGGNWGLELIRAPQMWNLNAAVQKTGLTIATGILDAGFTAGHPDLQPNLTVNLTPDLSDDHGAHVAGIIAAVHDNGIGVDGVSPFARLTVTGVSTPTGAFAALLKLISWTASLYHLHDLMMHPNEVRLINMSWGYSWGTKSRPINSATDTVVQNMVRAEALVLLDMFATVEAQGRPLPLLVVSAGNSGGQPARYNSAWNYASLVLNSANILVVEAVANSTGAVGGATRSSFSNVGGTLSAPGGAFPPGEQVWSTGDTIAYLGMQGTSMAAPHVTGLVSYLLALDPALTHTQLRELLLVNTVPVAGGARPRIDAFAAALDIDRLRGNDRVLKLLVDIDDGTPDGNRRVDADGNLYTADARGDGRVDMRDFRRWRDWLLQVENPDWLELDGGAAHPKKDLNGNGTVGTPAEENVYPRGDFNGDGILSRTATRAVPGAVNGVVTDLEMLMLVFDDEHYDALELPGLLDSGDLEIDASGCLTAGVAEVRSSIRIRGSDAAAQTRTHMTGTTVRQIYTAPVHPLGYTARAEARAAGGAVIATVEQDFEIGLGSDSHWRPVCAGLRVELTLADTVDAGVPSPLRVRVGRQPLGGGPFEAVAGAVVDLEISSGTVSPGSGVTDDGGYLQATVTAPANVQMISVVATATTATGEAAGGQVEAWVRQPPPEVVLLSFQMFLCDGQSLTSLDDLPASLEGSHLDVCNAAAAASVDYLDDGRVVIEGSASSSAGAPGGGGLSYGYWRLQFRVTHRYTYEYEAQGEGDWQQGDYAGAHLWRGDQANTRIVVCGPPGPSPVGANCPNPRATATGVLEPTQSHYSILVYANARIASVDFRLTLTPMQ
jgi:hypothetical protein